MIDQSRIGLWLEEMASLSVESEIKARAALIPAEPHLQGLGAFEIGPAVDEALKGLYVCSDQDAAIMKHYLGRAYAHGYSTYRDKAAHQAKLYMSTQQYDVSPVYPTCLTGLPGVGKSALIKAFTRVLPSPPQFEHGEPTTFDHIAQAAVPFHYWYVRITSHSSLGELLQPRVYGQLNGKMPAKKMHQIRLCAHAAHRDGTMFFIADEMQFFTQSETANSLVARLLADFAEFGLPYVFVANYSLCRRLLRRPPEERSRLLLTHHELKPAGPKSRDWHEYLQAVQSLLGAACSVDLTQASQELFQRTAGIKRLFISLIKKAFEIAWDSGARTLSISAIKQAYDSASYSESRAQAQDILLGRSSPQWAQYRNPLSKEECFYEGDDSAIALPPSDRMAATQAAMLEETEGVIAGNARPKSRSPATPRRPRSKPLTTEELQRSEVLRRGKRGIYSV